MKKKVYENPRFEVLPVNFMTVLMVSGSGSGGPDPAPRPRTGTETL